MFEKQYTLKTEDDVKQLLNSEGEGMIYCFSEDNFKKMSDEISNLIYARKSSMLIGALTVGMVAVGFKGYDMFQKFREKKYFVVLNGVEPFKSRSKEIVVFVKAKDVKEAEIKVKDIIENEFNNEYALEKIHEI